MAADALVAGTLLRQVISSHGIDGMQNKQVLVFHAEGFQWAVSSQCQEMIEDENTFLFYSKQFST